MLRWNKGSWIDSGNQKNKRPPKKLFFITFLYIFFFFFFFFSRIVSLLSSSSSLLSEMMRWKEGHTLSHSHTYKHNHKNTRTHTQSHTQSSVFFFHWWCELTLQKAFPFSIPKRRKTVFFSVFRTLPFIFQNKTGDDWPCSQNASSTDTNWKCWPSSTGRRIEGMNDDKKTKNKCTDTYASDLVQCDDEVQKNIYISSRKKNYKHIIFVFWF